HTRPMNWETVSQKFEKLARPFADRELRSRIMDTVYALEKHSVSDLTRFLASVRPTALQQAISGTSAPKS
ncbi:MAG: hypothetical protein ACM3KE_11050, partial [Hyphomicrobiales bacterium]